jgi:predicted RND superfamily exporter protein
VLPLARLLVRHPFAFLVGVLLVSVVAAAQLVDLRTGEILFYVDPSVDRLMPDSGPEREFYDDMSRRFGSDDVLTFAVVADDVFTPDVLTRIARITERFEEVHAVRQVISLSTALNIRDEGGELSVEPFFTELPEDPAAFEEMRRSARENPIYAGNLVSRDERATAIVVQVYPMPEREFSQAGIDLQLIQIAEEERGPAEVWLTGMPRIKAETSRILLSDLAFVIPAAYLVACLVALLSFRTPRGALVPATTVGLALLWTLGLMTALERPVNLVTVIVPPLLLAVGVAYTVHVVSAYYDAWDCRSS